MRILKLILFTVVLGLLCSVAYGQGTISFGATRLTDTSKTSGVMKWLAYLNSDANKFLTVNAQGKVVLATPTGGSSADSIVFSTVYRNDTGNAAIRSEKQNNITLTTNNTSGAATLSGDTLNVPIYAGQTYTAGNRLGLSANAFYLDTLGLFDYNFSHLDNFHVSTTGATNTQINSAISGVNATIHDSLGNMSLERARLNGRVMYDTVELEQEGVSGDFYTYMTGEQTLWVSDDYYSITSDRHQFIRNMNTQDEVDMIPESITFRNGISGKTASLSQEDLTLSSHVGGIIHLITDAGMGEEYTMVHPSHDIGYILGTNDTSTWSNRIDLKLNASDTASLSSRINTKQNYADTNTYDATRTYVNNAINNRESLGGTKKTGRYIVGWNVGIGTEFWQTISIQSPSNTGFATTPKVYDATNSLPNHDAVRFATTSASSSVAFLRTSVTSQSITMGASAGQGGGVSFTYIGGFSNYTAGSRWFCGYAPITTPSVTSTSDPSAMINMVGVGFDVADGTFQIMGNDGSGTATKYPTGITPNANDKYTITINIPAVSTSATVTITATSLSGSTTFTQVITTNMPATGTLLNAFIWLSPAATGVATRFDLIQCFEQQTLTN